MNKKCFLILSLAFFDNTQMPLPDFSKLHATPQQSEQCILQTFCQCCSDEAVTASIWTCLPNLGDVFNQTQMVRNKRAKIWSWRKGQTGEFSALLTYPLLFYVRPRVYMDSIAWCSKVLAFSNRSASTKTQAFKRIDLHLPFTFLALKLKLFLFLFASYLQGFFNSYSLDLANYTFCCD